MTDGELLFPTGVAADNNGYVYICSFNAEITKFDSKVASVGNIVQDSQNKFVLKWDSGACRGMETDNSGNLYVSGLQKIKVYDLNGNLIREWGESGSGNGQLRDTQDVAVNDALGRVYVADSKNLRVSVFDTNGNFLFTFGSEGTGNAQFSGPRGPYGITVDENTGSVYVADTEAHRVQKFDKDGNFLLSFGGLGNLQGQMKFPRDVEVDSVGNVYEADTDVDRIQKFDASGNFIMEFQGLNNIYNGSFHPRSVAVGSHNGDEYIYAASAYDKRIDKFDASIATSNFTPPPGTLEPEGQDGYGADRDGTGSVYGPGSGSGNYLESFGWLEEGNGVMSNPKGIAIDRQNGFIYVADFGNAMVQKFSTAGNYLTNWGYSSRIFVVYNGGNFIGNFDFPTTLAVGGNGHVFVLRDGSSYGGDPPINRIQEFDNNNAFVTSWNEVTFIEGMMGIVYNPVNGYIYIANTPRDKIQRFDVTGTLNLEFPFSVPGKMAVDSTTGDLYIVDANNDSIEKYDQNGNFILSFGEPGSQIGQLLLNTYTGIDIDNNGYVYVADGNRRIQVFDSNGQFNQKWGEIGYGDGQFIIPVGVVVDAAGYVFVLDSGRNDIQKFSPIIYNTLPVANSGGPYSGAEGQGVLLDGSGSTDSDGTIVLYEWDADNDGTYEYNSSFPTQSHTYNVQGEYIIKLRVTDNLGSTNTTTTTITVSDSSPTADFIAIPTSGVSPLTVDFTNNSTGTDQPFTYEWDFDNDGNTDATETNPSYNYTVEGLYTVKLSVTDNDSSVNSLTRTDYINVTTPVPDYTLTVNIAGNGSGNVTSSPEGVDCSTGGGDCTEVYDESTMITLTAVPDDARSIFIGWAGGGCSGTGECQVTISSDTPVTATFDACANPAARIDRATPVYFSSIKQAYDAALSGEDVQMQAAAFLENFDAIQAKSVTFIGGYNCDYTLSYGLTNVIGNWTVSDGTVFTENMRIE